MKARWSLLLLISLAACSAGISQFTFGVSPGLNLNGAYFGYQIHDVVVPYISLQFVGGSITIKEDGEPQTKVSAGILAPAVGVKYFAVRRAKIKGYFGLSLAKPLVTGKYEEDGEEDPDFKDALDNISAWGFEAGFGTEYFFDSNFSVGGEFGVRSVGVKYEENGGDYQVEANIAPTYTKLSLNYYFGASDEE